MRKRHNQGKARARWADKGRSPFPQPPIFSLPHPSHERGWDWGRSAKWCRGMRSPNLRNRSSGVGGRAGDLCLFSPHVFPAPWGVGGT